MVRDVNFYKFLKDAIVNKYRNANAVDFRTIEYDPWIYKWARDTFRELKTPEFLNIQNRDVLERLYERLHIDPRLKPLDDPDLALGNKDYQLSENFHQQHEADRLVAQQKVTTAGPAPGGESAGTMTSRGGPSTPSSQPPVIHNIPQIGPTGASPNLPRQVPIPEEGPDTAKARRLDEAKAIQVKGAAAAKPDLKFKPGFTNTFRNFGSRIGTFFQRNVGKYLTVGRAATGIGAVIGGFAGAGLTGGSSVGVLGGAVGGGILPSWFKSGGGGRFFGNLGNGAVNTFSRLSNQISGPRFLTGGASKRIVWVFLGMFLLFAIGAGVIGGLIGGGGTPSGEGGNVGIGITAPITPPPAPGGGSGGGGAPTVCSGSPVSFGMPKKFLPLPTESTTCSKSLTATCGRPGTCVSNPTRIVLHTTGGELDAEGTFQYFANGSDNRGVGAHFIIGKGGQTIQIVETLDQKVEVAYAVAGYSDHISIEIVHNGVYNNKNEVPAAQYQATLTLVRALMNQYHIPVGGLEYDWKAPNNDPTSQATPGVYGHYQLNPKDRKDPGINFMKDIKQDLK